MRQVQERARVPQRRSAKQPQPAPTPAKQQPVPASSRNLLLFAVVAFAVAIWAYWPALHGEFVFDDLHLPTMQQAAIDAPLKSMLGLRPIIMFTYWANLHLSGTDPLAYHAVNLFFHFAATVFLFLVVRKILQLSRVAEPQLTTLSALLSVIFLLHPMQTEAVSYIAQRGESMGATFFFAAWALFLYRRKSEVSWPLAAAILALYGAAVATKEHTVTLPAVLLLSDYFFHPEVPGFTAVRRNWRLYLPIVAGGAIGIVLIARIISRDPASIGFSLKEFTWYQYLFTQWRAFFAYLGLFVFPVWQNIDHDFSLSRTPWEGGAIFALAAILALLSAAIYFRKRYPLACFGLILFVVMLLPTSSVIPIKDVLADRRLYLPMTGLLFICAEALRRFRHTRMTAIILMALLAFGTFSRNQVWASQLQLWEDAAEKSPNKQRVQFGVAVAEFRANHCRSAVEHYSRAAELEKPDYTLLMNWGLAYECDNQPVKAMEKMQESLRSKATAQAFASESVLFARQGKVDEAFDALWKAQQIDPGYAPIYFYRSKMLIAMDRNQEAIQNLQALLRVDPGNESARQTIEQLQRQAR